MPQHQGLAVLVLIGVEPQRQPALRAGPLEEPDAGAEDDRQALGIAVFFGMIGVTLFGLLFTPSFYIISRKFGDRVNRWLRRKPRQAPASGGEDEA